MTKPNGKLANSPRMAKLVGYYVELRNAIDTVKERQKDELKQPQKQMEILAAELIKELEQSGVESARTKFGTVSLSSHDSASCSDPNLFIEYVREHDAYELINRHPNPTACKDFVKTHGTPPPGVKLNSKRTVRVNSPREEIAE
jgi:hypothetical protein